ncbi:MAG: hypothetical protein PHY08_13660 [Candidatus Cloacimonetes bacterium]|nr:hypothetical protein [Candidatus Cloacimonadota bacterium]
MDKKEKNQLKLTIMNVLYYVDEKSEQDKMITILEKYNARFVDSKFKDFLDKLIKNTKKDYFEKVDYLIKDIFENHFGNKEKNIIMEMLSEIKPIFEQAQRTVWDRFVDLFKWS